MVTEQERKDAEYVYGDFPNEESRLAAIESAQAEIDRVSREQEGRKQSAQSEINRIQEEINAQIRRDYGVYESELTRSNSSLAHTSLISCLFLTCHPLPLQC